jgi:hypothetical protein
VRGRGIPGSSAKRRSTKFDYALDALEWPEPLLCPPSSAPASSEAPCCSTSASSGFTHRPTPKATRIEAKVAAYTYDCYINRLLGRPQGRIRDLWA